MRFLAEHAKAVPKSRTCHAVSFTSLAVVPWNPGAKPPLRVYITRRVEGRDEVPCDTPIANRNTTAPPINMGGSIFGVGLMAWWRLDSNLGWIDRAVRGIPKLSVI
jgi:hypothetical protein